MAPKVARIRPAGDPSAGTGPPPFRPFPGLANAHAQTIVARALRARLPAGSERVRIDTDDGDVLDLDLRLPDAPRGVCLLLHGLEGCASSGYILAAGEALLQAGVACVALNFRSCGGEPNRTVGSYHSGRTDDLVRALRWIEGEFPQLPRAAIGFSLGGNALLVHLGGGAFPEGSESEGSHPSVDAPSLVCAAAVSVPFDLAACADALERGPGRLYARRFLHSLRAKVREKARRFPDAVPADAAVARTLRELDDRFTAPVHGFRDADDYYARCSSGRFVPGVRTPTLVLQSADDPLVPRRSIPFETLAGNPALDFVLTRRGGHVGFLDRGGRVGAEGWMERALAAWVGAALGVRP